MPQVRDPKTGRYTSGGGSSVGGAAGTNPRIQKAKAMGGGATTAEAAEVSKDMMMQSAGNATAYFNRKIITPGSSQSQEAISVLSGESKSFRHATVKNETLRAAKEMKRAHAKSLKDGIRDALHSESYLKSLVAADDALIIMIENTPVVIPPKGLIKG